jgi:hypothetical protein
MKALLCLILLFFISSSTAQYTCVRNLPEVQQEFELPNMVEWNYFPLNDTLSLRVTLSARFGWVGVGWHSIDGYNAAVPMNGSTLVVGYLSSNAADPSCINAYQGAINPATQLPYPSADNVPLPNIFNKNMERKNNEQLVMSFSVLMSTIPGFQATGGKLLAAYRYQPNPMDLQCPAGPTSATDAIPAFQKHAVRDTLTATLPPRAVFHGHSWAAWDNVNNCTPGAEFTPAPTLNVTQSPFPTNVPTEFPFTPTPSGPIPSSRFYNKQQCEEAEGDLETMGNRSVCILKFEHTCGSDVCNDYDHVCNDLPDGRGKTCISKGSFLLPDAAVVIIVQIIASGLFLPLGLIMVCLNIEVKHVVLPTIVTTLLVLNSFFLFFSYFYLNAYVIVLAAFASLALFGQRRPSCTVIGMFMCLLALFWVSYQYGLGNIQHHSRFNSGNSINDMYENYCDAYYRGFFFSPQILKSYDENPQVKFWGFCNRYWLAALLFFMILQELYLVLLVGAGALSLMTADLAWSSTEPIYNTAPMLPSTTVPVAPVAPVVVQPVATAPVGMV